MYQFKNCRYGPMIYLDNDRWIGESLNYYGEVNFYEIDLLNHLLEEGDVAIDIGAHIGTITVPMAQKVGPEGCVISFEPQRPLFLALCGNIALNNLLNVFPFNKAAFAESNHQVFLPVVDYTSQMAFGGLAIQNENTSNAVATLSIDDLNLSDLKLIKIDVEGNEDIVVEGAMKTIRRCKPFLYVEYNAESIVGIQKLLSVQGYRWMLHEVPVFHQDNFFGNKEDILRHENAPDQIVVSSNLLCFPDGTDTSEFKGIFFVDVPNSDNPRHAALKEFVS